MMVKIKFRSQENSLSKVWYEERESARDKKVVNSDNGGGEEGKEKRKKMMKKRRMPKFQPTLFAF